MSLGEYIPNAATKLLLHMNGNSNDSSGGGNNGTDTGITYSQADGKFNQGANFNATTDKILIANESNFDFERTQPFTISMFVKITHSAALYHFFAAKQIAGGNYTGWVLWENNGVLLFELVSSPSSLLSINTPFTETAWMHIVATYSGNSNSSGLKLYKNGNQASAYSSTNTLGTNSILNNIQLELGNRNGAFNFNGSMDEVIIENREWTAAQVKKYYTNATKGWAMG